MEFPRVLMYMIKGSRYHKNLFAKLLERDMKSITLYGNLMNANNLSPLECRDNMSSVKLSTE